MSQQLGSYEFRICSKDNIHGAVTQECLDQNVLMVKDNTAVNSVFRPRYYVTPSIRNMPNHKITAKIPNGLTCKHCVLQWKFISGKKQQKSTCTFIYSYAQVHSMCNFTYSNVFR